VESALNVLEKFAHTHHIELKWPISVDVLSSFINWCVFHKNLAPSSITSYMSHIKLIHCLRGFDASACENFLCKTQLKGAKNLQFYKPTFPMKKVMNLPLLKILGHSIAISSWTDHSKSLVWAASCVAFFGSFRFGELLPKTKFAFNSLENLMWSDLKFFDDDSIQFHI